MKNDIDSILDALFSGGKLNVGSGTKSRAAKDAEDFLNSIEKTNANMQSSLNRQISDLDKLTSDAQRSMDEMRRLLDAEGLTGTPEMEAPKAETAEKKPKAKGAEEPPQDPAQSFREAREATGRTVIGQDAFLDSLFTAFRRPSVTGRENGKPAAVVVISGKEGTKVMNLLEMLQYYLCHQEDVVTRRTQYDLNKAQERAHILKGLLIALDNIDEVIRIIRGSKNVQEAKAELIKRFGLSDAQAQAIVDMRLRALTGLEREKIEAEYAELMKKIEEYKAILADKKLLLGVIKKEILVIAEKYGDDRRTKIGFDEFDISMEDLIPRENVVITMTKLGYIKRMSMDTFKSQNRGGKGIKGMQTLEDDYIRELFITTSHHYIMFFTNTGRVYRLKAYEIPEAGRTARGTAIINLLQLMPEEKITAIIPLREYEEGKYLFMATEKGLVKKTPIQDYANVRKTGLAAIVLREDDKLIEVKITDNTEDIFLVTKYGMCIRFNETDVRSTGRVSMGVRGMNLTDNDVVIGMQIESQGKDMLIVSERGMGKRTDMDEFTRQNRGGKGVKCYKITEKTGNVVGMKAVDEDSEIMIINTEGIIIRMKCSDISVYGRITSGVKLINLKENDTVASVAKVRKASAEIDGEEVEISDEDESEKSEEGSVSETTEQETTEE